MRGRAPGNPARVAGASVGEGVGLDFLRHSSGVRWRGKGPGALAAPGRWGHRPAIDRAIPRSGCVPAEPASVSPGRGSVTGKGLAEQGGPAPEDGEAG